MGNTRARVEMVERAGTMYLSRDRHAHFLHKLSQDFQSVGRIRNKLCHAQYEISDDELWATAIMATDFSGEILTEPTTARIGTLISV
jgi:hypothetical protein